MNSYYVNVLCTSHIIIMKAMGISCWILLHIMTFLKNTVTFEYIEGYRTDGEIERVLINDSAKIKCDISSNLESDQVLLIVWYKNNLPIFSYDTRGAHSQNPSIWHDVEVLERRSFFTNTNTLATLEIVPVMLKDAGNFRCRVDFKLSPTRNANVNLEIVVPPQVPRIFDEKNKHIDYKVGPYEEGSDLKLRCTVIGGTPEPKVIWLSNGETIPNTILEREINGVLNSRLIVRNLTRYHFHSVYTCQASNFHKKMVFANVTIDLHLRPLSVEILFSNQPLSSDRNYEMDCQAVGSRPPAKITWWMDGSELTRHIQKVSPDGNVTTSTLFYTPTRQDNGKTLVCRAINELGKRSTKETNMKINVCYIPILTLVLGSNLNPDDIEEKDDVYFECKVHANPAAYKVIWKHNGQTIQHNVKAGVIVNSGDLVLRDLKKEQAGNYTCIASNVEGDGESNTVELKVMYKPLCRPDQQKIYGVARNEAADILCEVDSYPPPENFKWAFNNTVEMIDMPESGFQKYTPKASKLTYTPVKEMDFGTVMCWADNFVGHQTEPCVFHLIAAGKPDAPSNCTLVNQTSNSLEIACKEGFDGGQTQTFIMEIYDDHTKVLQTNLSSKLPKFYVNDLHTESVLKIVIFAENVKGRSENFTFEPFALKAAEKQTGTNNQFELAVIFIISIAVIALTCTTLLIRITYRILRSHRQQQIQHKGKHNNNNNNNNNNNSNNNNNNNNNNISRPGHLSIKEIISLPLSQSEEMYDEKNPDVVPSNEDPDYKLKLAAQTPALLLHNAHINEDDIVGRTIDDDRNTYLNSHNDELHYAELSIAMPRIHNTDTNSLPKKPPAYDYFDEPTIYAQIDHNNYKTSPVTSPYPTLISPSSAICKALYTSSKPFSREIVTIRTPLVYTQQESCV